jgi:hypothetical protein
MSMGGGGLYKLMMIYEGMQHLDAAYLLPMNIGMQMRLEVPQFQDTRHPFAQT